MQAVIAFLIELVGLVSTVVSIVEFVRGQVAHAAQEHTPYRVETDVQTVLDNLNSGLFGLSHIAQSILDARDAVNDHIDAALDGLTVSATIPDQPSWYTPPSDLTDYDSVAYYVWSKSSSVDRINGYNTGLPMQTLLEAVASLAILDWGWRGRPIQTAPWFSRVNAYPDGSVTGGATWHSPTVTGLPAAPVWANWVDGDTPYSFLAREQPAYGWQLAGPGGINDGRTAWKPSALPAGDFTTWVRSNFTELDVQAILAAPPPEVSVFVPPVFPGEANVTYGTSHALSDGLTITEAMHGLRVTITGAPAHAGRYAFDDVISWQHVGAVIFEDDGGHFERAEAFGLEDQIIVPKTMVQASGCIVRLNSGWSGTIRSWTINP